MYRLLLYFFLNLWFKKKSAAIIIHTNYHIKNLTAIKVESIYNPFLKFNSGFKCHSSACSQVPSTPNPAEYQNSSDYSEEFLEWFCGLTDGEGCFFYWQGWSKFRF